MPAEQCHYMRSCPRFAALAAIAVFLSQSSSAAKEAALRPVLSNLGAPVAIAVRPDSGTPPQVIVADRATGRIIQINGGSTPGGEREVTGFPQGTLVSGKSPVGKGLTSILFLDHSRLVAAGGGDDGRPFVWMYDLASDDANVNAGERKQEVGLEEEGNKSEGANSIRALVRTRPNDRVPDVILGATAAGDRSTALWRIAVRANTLADTAVNDAVEKERGLGSVAGMALSSAGYIVLACPESQQAEGSKLQYINPMDGNIAMQLPIKLPRLSAIAFSPSTLNLYVANSGSANEGGGVYRLDDASTPGKPACKAVKIASVSHPIAIAFAPGGELYVGTLGEEPSTAKLNGAVFEISGQL